MRGGERVQRYANAIDAVLADTMLTRNVTASVLEVADAEQAELRAEVERLRGTLVGTALTRMDAADARVARVEAVLDEWAVKADAHEPVHGEQVMNVRRVIARIRGALDGAEWVDLLSP